jgi:hypothetical protein
MEWYEWVFAACIGSMVLGSMAVLHDVYMVVIKRRDPRTGEPWRRKG